MRYLILSLILISNTAFGEACDLPEKITIGDKAPCNGYLFSDADELKIRTNMVYQLDLSDNLRKQNTIQSDMLKISAEEIALYKSSQPLTTWEKALYFGLGVVATSLAIDGASKLK